MTVTDALNRPPSLIDVPNVVLTVEEAAKALRIGRTSMYALIKSGAIQTVLIGGLRRVPVTAIHSYVASLLSEQANQEGDIDGRS